MLDCLTASPCVEAYRAAPMTTSEIDAHPDRARIWATVEAMKAGFAVELQEAHEGGITDANTAEEEAADAAYADAAKKLQHIVDNVDDSKVLEELEGLIEEWS